MASQEIPCNDSKQEFFGKKTCCVITGASKGIGRTIVVELAKWFSESNSDDSKSLTLVLSARDEAALNELASNLRSEHGIESLVVKGSLDDTGVLESFEQTFEKLSSLVPPFDKVVIIHNAASLGDPKQLVEGFSSHDLEQIDGYLRLNVSSVIALNGAFLTKFAAIEQKAVINITSLLAIQAMKGTSLYSIGKAAREAYIRALVCENPKVRVLNYSPGPVQTDMVVPLANDSHNQAFFSNKANLLTTLQTVTKFVGILKENTFENGATVDYFGRLKIEDNN